MDFVVRESSPALEPIAEDPFIDDLVTRRSRPATTRRRSPLGRPDWRALDAHDRQVALVRASLLMVLRPS